MCAKKMIYDGLSYALLWWVVNASANKVDTYVRLWLMGSQWRIVFARDPCYGLASRRVMRDVKPANGAERNVCLRYGLLHFSHHLR